MIMDDLIKHLEKQINELVSKQQQLHHGRRQLIREKDVLLTKQQKAVSDIQDLLSQLKAIEKTS